MNNLFSILLTLMCGVSCIAAFTAESTEAFILASASAQFVFLLMLVTLHSSNEVVKKTRRKNPMVRVLSCNGDASCHVIHV